MFYDESISIKIKNSNRQLEIEFLILNFIVGYNCVTNETEIVARLNFSLKEKTILTLCVILDK